MDKHETATAPRDPGKRARHRSTRFWLRVTGSIVSALVLPILIGIVTLTALVNADGFHRYLLGLLQKKATDALGVRVELENFTLHPQTLSVDLYGIRVSGAEPYANPPLLQADHVEVGIRVVSVFRRTWYLDRLQFDHSVVWVVVDKKGVSNIPTFKSRGSSNTTVFDLGIRHAVLNRGQIYYNDRSSSLAADLQDIEFRASFNSLRTMYSGQLKYAAGQLEFGSFRPFRHDFDAEFDATPSAFSLKQAKITSGASQAIVSAILQNYSNPAVQGKYFVVIDGHQMAQLLDEPSLPSGSIRASGSVQSQQEENRSLVQTLTVNGDLASGNLAFNASTARASLRNLTAHYSLANGDATLRDLRADLLGGELTAQGTMLAIGDNSRSSFRTVVHRISLAEVRAALGDSASAKDVALTGEADATATATWGKTLTDLVAHADATVNGQAQRTLAASTQVVATVKGNSATGNGSTATIPIAGVFHATYANSNQELRLDNSSLRTFRTNLDLNGAVSNHSSLLIHLQANDLGELVSIANLFRPPGSPALDLAGSASFQGSIQGSTVAPHLTGQLTTQKLHVNGTDWKVLRTGVDLSPSQVVLQNVDLEPAARGRITGSVTAGLQKWSFSKQSPIKVSLNASQLEIATVTKLARQDVPITGTLSARIDVHGNMMNPEGNGNITLAAVTAYEQPISSLKLDFTGSANQAQANLSVQLPAGTIESRITAQPQQRIFTAQLSSNGIDLAKLQALQVRDINAKGVLAIQANGQGTFDNPEMNADLQIPTLTIDGQTFSGIKLQMNVANRVANAEMSSSVADTSLRAKAQVNMTGDYLTDASFDTQSVPLQPFLAVYAPEEAANVTGQTEIHATLHGPLKNMKQFEAQVTIPVLKVGYSNTIQLAAASPIHIDYKNNVIDLQPTTIRGTDTDLQLQGSIPINSGAPMSLKAQGTVNLQLAQLFEPDLRSSGQLKLNIDSHGTIGSGELGGEIDIVDANLASIGSPASLQHANGVLKLTTDRLEITKFDGTIGSGPITAQGAIVYRPKIQFDIGATAKAVRMLYPQGMRESVDANLRLTGSTNHAVLGGSVNITDLSFTPAFDLSTFVDQFSGGVAAPVGPGFEQNLSLNIAVSSTSNANLVSRALSVAGSASLQVRGSAAEPVILGRVNLSGGDVILNGERFVLTGGTVQFINPAMTQPVLNVALTTTIQQYKIDLRFSGPSDQMQTQYSSDPALPPADIINLLAFGQTSEASAMNATPANQQAESLVASQVSGQVTSRISKAAGISQLSISPVLAGSTAAGPPGANLTIQQRVTGNLFVTFSTNVATTQGQTIQGQYQVSPRVAVSATRDPNGGFAVDTLIKKSW